MKISCNTDNKIPFVIFNTDYYESLSKLIDWIVKTNTTPMKIIILNCATSDAQLLLYYKRIQKQYGIDIINISKNITPQSVLKNLGIKCNSKYFVFATANIHISNDNNPDLIQGLLNLITNVSGISNLSAGLNSIDSEYCDFSIYKNHEYNEDIVTVPNITSTKDIFKANPSPALTNKEKSKIENKKKDDKKLLKEFPPKTPIIKQVLKGKQFNCSTSKGISTIFKFLTDFECEGWGNTLGKVTIKNRRAKILWDNPVHGETALDFNSNFEFFTGYSLTEGKLQGQIIKDFRPQQKILASPNKKQQTNKISFDKTGLLNSKKYSNIFMVVAAFGPADAAINRFVTLNSKTFVDNGIRVIFIRDKPYVSLHPWIHNIIYPKTKETFWSMSKILNYAIRSICNQVPDDAIIIRSDIDIIFSNEVLLDISRNVKEGFGISALCGHISETQAPNWKNLKWESFAKDTGGKGACFAISKQDWIRLNGFDERMTGYGHEDTEVWIRACRTINIHTKSVFPLFHIDHPNRKNTTFPDHIKRNEVIMYSKDHWKNEKWGMLECSNLANINLNESIKKSATLCMIADSTQSDIIKSINSIVNKETNQYLNFIIIQDSKNKINSNLVENYDLLEIYTVDNIHQYSKSKMYNFMFKKCNTNLISPWKPGFIFSEDFCQKFNRYLTQTNFNREYIRIMITEINSNILKGRKFIKGELYGGFYIYLKQFFDQVRGLDEEIEDEYGISEFNIRLQNLLALKERLFQEKNLILNDNVLNNDISNPQALNRYKELCKARQSKMNQLGFGNLKYLSQKVS